MSLLDCSSVGGIFAALNTVAPPILELGTARLLERDKPWSDERRGEARPAYQRAFAAQLALNTREPPAG